MNSLRVAAVALLAATAQLASAWPQPPVRAQIHSRQEEIADEYDYIIVGGGTSGLTVGDRLTENGNYSVLVIEIGLYHNRTGMAGDRMFNINSQPSPKLNGRRTNVGLGRGVGGSSIVNGQLMLRGTKEEYDAWGQLGGPDSTWDWEGLLPYFKKAVTLVPPSDEVAQEYNISIDMDNWGQETPIYATYGPGKPPSLTKILFEAMAGMPGMTVASDPGAGENGVYWYSTSQDPETHLRSYARTGHWDNVPRDNYHLVVGAKVDHVMLEGAGANLTATGVQFASVNGTSPETKAVRARREVILAAGTVHTPQVLMLSGVGPKAALDGVDIAVKVDLPGVGSNFQDHSYIPFIGYTYIPRQAFVPPGCDPSLANACQSALNPPWTALQPPPGGSPDGLNAAPNLVAMVGLPVISPDRYEELASRYEQQDPTTHLSPTYTAEQVAGYRAQQALYAGLMRSPGTTFNEMMLFQPGGSIQNMHPASRGVISLNATDPHGEVVVDYRGASNDIDIDVMVEHVRFMRRYMASDVFAPYEPAEFSPGPAADTDEELRAWVRGEIIPSVYHPIGTCAKVPRDMGGVVSEDLMVYGTARLSIVDASIFPTLVGATTQMSVYAAAEKAAAIIMARTQE